MRNTLSVVLRALLSLSFILCCSNVRASHIYGADLFYTHVSGNTYTVTMVIYGDCSGQAFPNLSSSSPEIEVYNNNSLYQVIDLIIQAPSLGTEVTPVCPAQLNNTNCVSSSGTIPGVKRFTYKANVTLNTTSTNWRFRFAGNLGLSGQAGRSNTITNVPVSVSNPSITALEATLNNTTAANSSPTYTTIPTPFFCINKAASYNPGTVDVNNDNLSYALVPALEGLTGGTVTYNAGYSGSNPLSATGFSFGSTTGQLNFTPNIVQRSLVVTKVEEYRNNVLVGTSMREMTFVVLSNCNNNPPGGTITNVSGGTLINTTNVNVCQNQAVFTFNINPTDLDGNTINVSASGIPAGASFTITNNNTVAPVGTFLWNLNNVTPGTYNFFITYTDDGCPLSSRQTIAYTITVLPAPTIGFALVSPATCTKKARFNIATGNITPPWVVSVLQGTTTVHTITGVTGTQLDSLSPGTYTIRITATNTCIKDTLVTIAAPPVIIPSVAMVSPSCNGGSNGSITLTAAGGLAPFQYAMGTGMFSSTNIFTGLTAGSYLMRIKDANDCIKDTTVLLLDIPAITPNITFVMPPCNFYSSGVINVTATNGVAPYQYALGTGPFSTTNTFSGLSSDTYLIRVRDANGCIKDSLFVLPDSINVHANAAVTHVLCFGNTTGAITLTAFGATAPYQYKMGTGPLGNINSFSNLPAGNYTFHIEDVNQCYLDTLVIITQPPKIFSTSVITHVSCTGVSDGTITTTPSGGVAPYNYALGAGPFGPGNSFSGLAAGTYTIHIKDFNGCPYDTTIIITEPTPLIITNITSHEPICNGYYNGYFTITASGGTPAYTYAVNTGTFGSSNILSGLNVGVYTLRVKDANGCQRDSVVTLTEPTPIIPVVILKNSTCSTLGDGKVTLIATGGYPQYQYAVNALPYSASPAFNNLAAATYVFHIRDSYGCIKDTVIQVFDSLNVAGTASVSDALCFDDTSGKIIITPHGGASPYTFAKGLTGPFLGSNVIPNLHAGTYVIRIKDANGCIKDTSIIVNEPTYLVPLVTSTTSIICHSFNNGQMTLNATGGTPAYTFSLNNSPFASAGTYMNLFAGTYLVKVKDQNGCIRDTTIILTQPNPLLITSLQVQNVACFGDSSATVVVSAANGTPAYQYRWDYEAFGGSNTITGIPAGQRIIRVRDANGCFKDTTITITQPTALFITGAVVTNPTCEGFTDGSIAMSAAGGVSPFSYSVNNSTPAPGSLLGGLAERTYLITLTDRNGCKKDTTVTLKGYPPIIINEIISESVSCFGREDGKIVLNDIQGGNAPLTYYLGSTRAVENAFAGLRQASYTITIVDSKNCKKDTTVTVGSPDDLVVKLTATNNDCEGFDDGGMITSTVEGGTKPYAYRWNTVPERNSADATSLGNGSYMVWVTDANECIDSAGAQITYISCCKVFVPDAFTPNNDGKNDKIRIMNKGDLKLKQFSIYNRFGQRVFYTENVADGWDGTINGVPQDLGTFNYYILGVCGSAGVDEVEFKGTITLIR